MLPSLLMRISKSPRFLVVPPVPAGFGIAAVAAVALFAPVSSPAADTPAAGVPVNVRLLAQQRAFAPVPYDTHPSFVVDASGKGVASWHSFAAGNEWIVARALPAVRDAVMSDVAGGRGIMTPPEIAADPAGATCVTWAAFTNGRWHVMARRLQGIEGPAPVRLSAPEVDAVYPSVSAAGPGSFRVAWSELRGGRFVVVTAVLGDDVGAAVTVSAPDTDAFRPTFAKDGAGASWVFWDAYQNGHSAVYARRLTPELGPVERVSTSPDRCLKPVATGGKGGELHVAWVKVTDVTGGEGVIDQVHSIEMARRQGDRWEVLAEAGGRTELAVLAHGLTAKIEPKPEATGGYLGRRRDPMLVRDGEGVWLLWERKATHTGGTTNVTGDLCGRRITSDRLGEPVALAQGWLDYRVAHDGEIRDGKLELMACTLPRSAVREHVRLSVAVSAAKPLATEAWQGWTRVSLPLPDGAPQRHEIVDQGRTYRLVWMDSHVHSGLSADAEGEPDEIVLYARDRGRLDALVMQENDFYNGPLTEWEYQLGGFFSRAFSRDGQFVALPGYEWTQQRPSDPGIDLDQPRFWRANYPNHRTVIYPRAGGPLVRYVDVQGDIRKLHEAVERAGGILHTQHPVFDSYNHPVETAIEVTAGWGVYFLNPGRIHAALKEGLRPGFVGTSDSHRRNPGLGGGITGLYVSELTPDAILDAYRARRVFATAGARIVMEARANGVFMGQEAKVAAGPVKLTLQARGTRPLRQATLVRDGVEVKTLQAPAGALTATFEHVETDALPGTHWYYWRVEQDGSSKHYGGNVMVALGNLAWSTPNWVTVGSP